MQTKSNNKAFIKKELRNKMNLQKKDKLNFLRVFYLILAGAVIGLLNGFFGGGGGMVCVPLLEKVLFLNNKEAHASAILVIFPLSFLSACLYIANGYIATFPFIYVTIGTTAGGLVGAFALKRLNSKVIRCIFALLMLLAGLRLLFS